MKYYDELLSACHYALEQYHNGHDGQKVPYKKMAEELNAGSAETLRKIAGPDYKDLHPTLRTLEDLRKALKIAAPDYDMENDLSLEAQIDLHSVGVFFEIFDRHQRNRVLHYCGELDADRKYYESGENDSSPAQRSNSMAADRPVQYGDPLDEGDPADSRKNSGNISRSTSRKQKPDHPESSSERKAD